MSITHHLINTTLSALAHLPLPALRLLARVAAAAAWHLHSPIRRVIETNLALCFPALPAPERSQLARQATQEIIQTGLEMPRLWLRDNDNSRLLEGIEGAELVEAARAAGEGIIMVCPHLGLWEFFILEMGRRYQVTVMCNNIDDIIPAFINDTIQNARMKTGAKVAEAKPGIRQHCESLLQNGEMVMVAPDQIPDNKKAYVFADFFGQPAATMTLLPRLAENSRARVMAGFAKRLPDGRYRLVIKACPQLEQRFYGDVNDAALAMNQLTEQLIAEAPAQYLWTYKRFRVGPEGKRKIYRHPAR